MNVKLDGPLNESQVLALTTWLVHVAKRANGPMSMGRMATVPESSIVKFLRLPRKFYYIELKFVI